jgi:hypothetical protein
MRLGSKNTNQSINFLGFECRIEVGQYSNGWPALELVEIGNDEPVLVATVNMPFEPLFEDELLLDGLLEDELLEGLPLAYFRKSKTNRWN